MLEGIKSCKLKNHDEIIKFFRKMSSSLRHGGTKKLCLICQQTRIRMITSVFCVNKKDGTMKDVPCPVSGRQYNIFMFGVDRADQLRMQ